MQSRPYPCNPGIRLANDVSSVSNFNVLLFAGRCAGVDSAQGVAAYFRGYKGHRFASTKEAVAMSEGFRRQVFDFAERHGIPIIRFEKGMRKDDVMDKRLRKFKAPGRRLYRHRPGEGSRAAHHPQRLRGRRGHHPMDRLRHGHG
jgi:hypothetical protein